MNRTKIICTLGPATDAPEVLREMIISGLNVARLNFSHGSHEEHKIRAEAVKRLRKELGKPVAVMIDTKGPDIRVGRFAENFIELQAGQEFVLVTYPVTGDSGRAYITYADLPKHVRAGDTILLDDGLISIRVTGVRAEEIFCTVLSGGILANNKSLNVPGISLNIPYMREKDIDDLKFAIENDFDYIAASFVREAADVLAIRELMKANNAADIKIIAKIENSEGIANIEKILAVSDGIMVARGDMGVEIDFRELPSIQKLLLKKAACAGKISITATQMLESMIAKPRPTRAEITDVANAIYDGSGAIMLSGETAVGKYPLETLRTMVSIAERTEQDIDYRKRFSQLVREGGQGKENNTDAISHAVCSIADDIAAKAIITPTQTGYTANMVSRYRPTVPIIACTPYEKKYYQMALSWGVVPVISHPDGGFDSIYESSLESALTTGLVKRGDTVVVTAGMSPGIIGGTNSIRIGIV